MKKYILSILSLSLLFFSGCEKDNYDEPASELKGRIVSPAGDNVGVRETEEAVQLQLWQDGYELYTSIPVYVNQDGTFSAKLFDGTYKLVSRDNNGPWVNDRDTVVIQVKGNTTVDYPVKSYFALRNETFKVENNILTATFNVEQITAIQDRTIERITLYVNNTRFVDTSFNKKSADVASPVVGTNAVTMDLSGISNPVLYARIGVKIRGVDQLLYTTGSVQVK